MRFGRLLGFVAGAITAGAASLTACSSDDVDQPLDAGSDAANDVADAGVQYDEASAVPDAAAVMCTLDNGGDPVALCVQKSVLESVHEAGFAAKRGVASSWSSTSFIPDADDAGTVLHDPHVDVAYAARIADYHNSSGRYGDNERTAEFDADLQALVPIVASEFSTLPTGEYDGDLYLNLRSMAYGLRYINDLTDANTIDAIADKYGRAIAAQFAFVTASTSSPDAGTDAGSDASDAGDDASDAGDDASDASASDSGTNDSGTSVDAGSQGDGVIGISSNGQVDYRTADVATGALALIDMASRHAADDQTDAATWAKDAVLALAHLSSRARDTTSGLYFRELTTSNDSGHDQLTSSDGEPPDLLSSDVQGVVALALMRSLALVTTATGTTDAGTAPLVAVFAPLANYPFESQTETIFASLNGTNGTPSLYDTTAPNGYMEGYIPSTMTLLTNKTLRGNAAALAALHHLAAIDVTPYTAVAAPLRLLLVQSSPADTSFLSAEQATVAAGGVGYFEVASRTFDLPSADGGLPVVNPTSYSSEAAFEACDALTEEWFGLP